MDRINFDVKKISIGSILELPEEAIDLLNEKEKRTLASRLASAANKRLKRALEKGSIDTTPKFSIRGRKGDDLEFEIKRARLYLSHTQRSRTPSQVQSIIDTPYEVWRKYNKETLQSKVKILAKTANARIRALRKSGLDSPALTKIEEEGGLISVANKNINELRFEYSRAKNFLTLKTSTVSGTKDWMNQSLSTIKKIYNVDIGKENFDLLWKTWDLVRKYNPIYKLREYKYEMLERINNTIIAQKSMYTNLTADDIFNILLTNNDLETVYAEVVEKGADPSEYIEVQ